MRKILLAFVLPLLLSCASIGSGDTDVLEPIAPSVTESPSPSPTPLLSKRLEKLQALGYEGIGMTYESDATLELLNRVFSDPTTSNRQVRSVYTGLNNAYDVKAQSLTVGGTSSVQAILTFIQKKVPMRKY